MFKWLGNAVFGALLIICMYMILCLRSGTILAVQTASMVPAFAPGDAIIISTSAKNFSLGQVVSYRSRRDPRQIVSHRVVALDEKQQVLITKGDNLTVVDPPIRNWDVLGAAVFIVPKAGYILSFIFTWRGLICIIYMPAFLILLLEARRVIPRKNAKYSLTVDQKRAIVTAR